MKASEANSLAKENKLNCPDALKSIESAAKNGNNECPFNGKPLSEEAVMSLMELGYKVSKFTDPIIGIQFYKAEW
jgi:hypothetical protein